MQIPPHLNGGLVAQLRRSLQEFIQQIAQDGVQRLGQVLSPNPASLFGVVEVGRPHLSQQIDTSDSQAVEIAGVNRLADRLFRRGEFWATDAGSGSHQIRAFDRLGRAKIHQHILLSAGAPNNILGFDVAMDHLVVMNKLQHGQQVIQQLPDLAIAKHPVQRNLLQQIAPVDKFLHQVLIVRLLEVGQQFRNLGMRPQLLQPHRFLPKQFPRPFRIQHRSILGQKLLDHAGRTGRFVFVHRQKGFAKAAPPDRSHCPIAIAQQQPKSAGRTKLVRVWILGTDTVGVEAIAHENVKPGRCSRQFKSKKGQTQCACPNRKMNCERFI